MSDFFNLYPNGLPIHNPQWNVPQQPNYQSEWLARLVELEAERDAAVKRAEVAEAALAAVPVDAILALNGPDDYDFSGLMSDIEKFANWLEPLRAQRNASQLAAAQAVR